MSGFKLAIAASALALCASTASAALYDNELVAYSFVDLDAPRNIGVNAGVFEMTETTGGAGYASLGLGDSFLAFCLDIVTSIQDGKAYTINNVSPFDNADGVNLTQYDRKQNIQRLYDANYRTDFSNLEAAAFQVALWEVVYEVPSTANPLVFDASSGNFRTQTSAVNTEANKFLNFALGGDAGDYMGGTRFTLNFLQNVRGAGDPVGDSQNLVTGTATVVPLPAAGLLLFGALGALGFTSRRRKAVAEA